MSDFLAAAADGSSPAPLEVFIRLVVAMILGGAITVIYRRTRHAVATTPSFTVTLVLLTILIAMVTQVIGDNVARAFSLVGALSIVRFRTVVRDTQDTAYVIFAVAVGMAVGAGHPWLALGSMAVIGFAAWTMRERAGTPLPAAAADGYLLEVRMAIGLDPEAALASTLNAYLAGRRLQGVSTARQGMALDVVYRAELAGEQSAGDLVKALNRIDGVQAVTLQRQEIDAD
jgi:uncharacterized membrane protein YhiD involved in acid resistance